jgi:hypothetical protein
MVQRTQIIIDFNCSKIINVNMQFVKRKVLSKEQCQRQLAVGRPTNAVSAAPHIAVRRDNIQTQIHTDNPPNTNQNIYIFLILVYLVGVF